MTTAVRARNYQRKRCEEELDLLPLLCDPNKVSVDVGANLGLYAHFIARHSRRVLMLEPNEELSQLLSKVYGADRVMRVAASDIDGIAELRIPVRAWFDGRGIASLNPHLADDAAVILQKVPTVRLDMVVDEPVGFIKIDVEGHELAVLKGAEKLLRQDKPNLLVEIEERHTPQGLTAVINLLSAHGYSGYYYSGGSLRPIDVSYIVAQQAQYLREEFKPGGPDIAYLNNFVFTSEPNRLRALFK